MRMVSESDHQSCMLCLVHWLQMSCNLLWMQKLRTPLVAPTRAIKGSLFLSGSVVGHCQNVPLHAAPAGTTSSGYQVFCLPYSFKLFSPKFLWSSKVDCVINCESEFRIRIWLIHFVSFALIWPFAVDWAQNIRYVSCPLWKHCCVVPLNCLLSVWSRVHAATPTERGTEAALYLLLAWIRLWMAKVTPVSSPQPLLGLCVCVCVSVCLSVYARMHAHECD